MEDEQRHGHADDTVGTDRDPASAGTDAAGASTSSQDLHRRIRVLERALELERERHAAVFDRAPDAYVVTDETGRIQDVNLAFATVYEIEPRFARGKQFSAFVHVGDRSAFRAALSRLARGEDVAPWEIRTIGRSKRVVEIEVSATAEPRPGGGHGVVIGWLLRDIGARKEAERQVTALAADLERRVVERTAELEQERARLATMVEQMPVGVVLVSPAGDVLLSNEEVRRILGRDIPARPGDAAQINAFHLDGRRYQARELAAARVLRGEAPHVTELCEYERPDGTRILLEASAFLVRAADGTSSGAVTMFEDVTHRERRERAERDFVTNAAHELQSPIAAVLAAAEALEAGAKESPRDRDRFIRHITDACNRLARLTHALLVLARAQTGAEAARRELVPLAPLLHSVAGGTVLGEGIELRVECAPEAAALAHPGLLEQAVANLLANAAKHTQGGTIVLTSTTVNGSVEIAVTDTGTGIRPEDQERVTRRFVRVGGDRDGFGLGLAITDQAVRTMNGELRIESEVGRGTKMTIVLPSARLITA